jgi:hypothetical protein
MCLLEVRDAEETPGLSISNAYKPIYIYISDSVENAIWYPPGHVRLGGTENVWGYVRLNGAAFRPGDGRRQLDFGIVHFAFTCCRFMKCA